MVIDMHGEAARPSSVSAPLNSHFRQPWASEPHGTLQALEATPEGRFSSKTCLMRSGSEQVSPGLSTASPAGARTDREDSFLSFIFKPWRLWLPLLKSCLCAPRFFTVFLPLSSFADLKITCFNPYWLRSHPDWLAGCPGPRGGGPVGREAVRLGARGGRLLSSQVGTAG